MAILAAHASHRPLTDYGEVTSCLGAGTLGHDGHWMLDIVCVRCSSCHLKSLHSEHLGCALYSYFQVVHGKQIKVNVTNNFSDLLVSHNQATFLQSSPTPFYVPESEPPAVSAFHVVPWARVRGSFDQKLTVCKSTGSVIVAASFLQFCAQAHGHGQGPDSLLASRTHNLFTGFGTRPAVTPFTY